MQCLYDNFHFSTIIEEQPYCNSRIRRHQLGYFCYSKCFGWQYIQFKVHTKISIDEKKRPKILSDFFASSVLGLRFKKLLSWGFESLL